MLILYTAVSIETITFVNKRRDVAKNIDSFTDIVFKKLESRADVGGMNRPERLQYDEALKKHCAP